MEKRTLNRESGANVLFPVSCVLRGLGREYVAEVVNYHFKGACLRIEGLTAEDQELVRSGQFKLDFYMGQSCLQSDISYRVSWQDDRDGLMFGVEFQSKITNHVERHERFLTNSRIPIHVHCMDPMDSMRQIFFQVLDVSEGGMLLKTSLSNKQLFPGMKLKTAHLVIPTQDKLETELTIANTREGSDGSSFLLGVVVRANQKQYVSAIRNYLPLAMPQIKDIDQYFKQMSNSSLQNKSFKSVVTYRVIQTKEQYESVLKLRYLGYGKHDKIKKGTTWQDQGEGLENEGTIIGGFLGSELVCSMELRFGGGNLPLRTQKMLGKKELPGIDEKRAVELNKLVIHPSAQGTDLVIGMFQKAHTIVINRGQLDVLGVATDKLAKLYEGIGAIRLGVRFPHPHLEGEHLNLMLLKREVYHDGMRLNPHAWSVVYKTVHEHFVSMGLAQDRKLTLKDRAVASVTRLMLSRKKKKKFHSQKQEDKSNQASDQNLMRESRDASQSQARTFIDPKWTRQEFVASVMLPYVREAERMIGKDKVRQILDDIGVPESYLLKQSNWLSVSFHDAFLDAFDKHGDSLELSKRAGVRSMKRDMLGMNYFVLKHFLTPELAYSTFSKMMPKFNRTRTYEAVEFGPNRFRLSLGVVSSQSLPKRRESCDNWHASFVAYIELMTGKPGHVKKVSCCYNGSAACVWEVEWDRKYLKLTQFLPALLPAISGGLGYYYLTDFFGKDAGPLVALSCFLMPVFILIALRLRRLQGDYNNSYQEFMRFQQEATDRYEELQQAKLRADDLYREARLVEQTMRDIQQKDDVGSLLQTALDAVCSNFRFDRGFAMIVDEDRKRLRTAAVAGVDGSADAIWKFSVDISQKRENPALLSSVFMSGVSVVIDDVKSHIFQLNESSQAIVRQFGSVGFVMVAIPAKQGSWGVIIADKKTKERRLDQRDLVVLERLSQQIGIALDKKFDLQRERNLRSQFQRYAPSALLLSSANSEQQLQLGAQLKQVGVLFLDIRGFTKLSETLPPTKMVELVNGLYSVLDPIVRRHGGIVDKYLGDGALVTWGTLGSNAPNASQMIQCGLDFLLALTNHNQALNSQGLSPIKVGIGMHIGEALVGNVGSKERQEYTAIGSAVNLGARLEQLSKAYNASIVASDDIMRDQPDVTAQGWKKVDGVSIRGIHQPVSVWIYQSKAQLENSNVEAA